MYPEILFNYYYVPAKRDCGYGNAFGRVCLCVCVSVLFVL